MSLNNKLRREEFRPWEIGNCSYNNVEGHLFANQNLLKNTIKDLVQQARRDFDLNLASPNIAEVEPLALLLQGFYAFIKGELQSKQSFLKITEDNCTRPIDQVLLHAK